MHDPITLDSGAILQTCVSPFSVSNRLLKVILREAAAVNFDIETIEFDGLSQKDINTFKNVIFQIVASDTVEAALMTCMKKCLYNGQAIVENLTFESEAARADYLPVAWEVIKVNLRPFFKNLSSLLPKNGSPNTSDPK